MIIKFNNNKRYKYQYVEISDIINYIKYGNYKCSFYNREYNTLQTKYRVDRLFGINLNNLVTNIRLLKEEDSFKNYNLFFNTNYSKHDIDDKIFKSGIDDSFIKNVFSFRTPSDFASDLKNSLPAILYGIEKFGDTPHPKWENKPNSLNDNIKKLNKYIVIDIDHLPKSSINDIKSKLFYSFEFIVMVFISPSGDGIKIVCEFDDLNGLFNDITGIPYDTIRKMWNSLNEQILDIINDNEYGIIVERDESADDVNRLCYLSYDPDILYREDVYPFDLESLKLDGLEVLDNSIIKSIAHQIIEERKIKKGSYKNDLSKSIIDIERFIKGLQAVGMEPFGAHNYKEWMKVGFALCSLFEYNQEYYNDAYELFRRITLLDSYYGNYQGKGETEIRRQFDLKWNNRNENAGITYGSMVRWMREKDDIITEKLIKIL